MDMINTSEGLRKVAVFSFFPFLFCGIFAKMINYSHLSDVALSKKVVKSLLNNILPVIGG